MTTNFEIIETLQPILGNTFGGVFSKDQLAYKRPSGKAIIVNLQDSGGTGTHWTLVYDMPNECIYYDSYGLTPPDEIRSFMSRARNKKLVYSDLQHQALESDWCGEFCCFVCVLLFRGFSYNQIATQILTDDIARNERLVAGFIKRD